MYVGAYAAYAFHEEGYLMIGHPLSEVFDASMVVAYPDISVYNLLPFNGEFEEFRLLQDWMVGAYWNYKVFPGQAYSNPL